MNKIKKNKKIIAVLLAMAFFASSVNINLAFAQNIIYDTYLEDTDFYRDELDDDSLIDENILINDDSVETNDEELIDYEVSNETSDEIPGEIPDDTDVSEIILDENGNPKDYNAPIELLPIEEKERAEMKALEEAVQKVEQSQYAWTDVYESYTYNGFPYIFTIAGKEDGKVRVRIDDIDPNNKSYFKFSIYDSTKSKDGRDDIDQSKIVTLDLDVEYNYNVSALNGDDLTEYLGKLKVTILESENDYDKPIYSLKVFETDKVERENPKNNIRWPRALGTDAEIEKNNSMSSANRIKNDYDNRGRIYESDDVDWYVISFPSSGTANFFLGDIPSGKDYDLKIYNSSGFLVASSNKGGNSNELIAYDVAAKTNYYVKIYGHNDSNSYSQYLFRAKVYEQVFSGDRYETNDTLNRAHTPTPGVYPSRNYLSASIHNKTDVDYYKVVLNKKSTLYLNLQDVPSSVDYDLYLCNSYGNEISSSAYGTGSSEYIEKSLDAGTYYVMVKGYSGFSDQLYRLYFSVKEDIPASSLIYLNSPVDFNKSAGYDAVYRFTPTATRTYVIATSPYGGASSDSYDTVLELYSNAQLSGNPIISDDDSGYARYSRISYPLQSGVTYFIKVRSFDPSSSLSARISITSDNEIKYNANGGSLPSNLTSPQAFSPNTSVYIPSSVPTKSGMYFLCWNTNSAGTGTNYYSGNWYTLSNNLNLYAIYKPLIYVNSKIDVSLSQGQYTTYKFIPNATDNYAIYTSSYGAGTTTNDTFLELYSDVKLLNLISQDDDGGDGSFSKINMQLTKGQPYYIKLRHYSQSTGVYARINVSQNYKINYNVNGGVAPSGFVTTQYFTPSTNVLIQSKVPTRTGYLFDGWNTASNGTGVQYTQGQTRNITANYDITLYAKWKLVPTITYDYNYVGKPANEKQTFTPNTNVLIKNKPTRTGYVFQRWDTNPNGTGVVYTAGESKYISVSYDITLYAIWKPLPTITYDYNYVGKPTNQTQAYTPNTYVPIKSNPTRTGYVFQRWDTNQNGTGVTYVAGQSKYISANYDITLYAIWKAQYSITYNLNGGVAPSGFVSTIPFLEGDSVKIQDKVPTRSGYTFGGWYENSQGTGVNYQPGNIITINKNLPLYAKWIAVNNVSYTVNYNLNGGTGETPLSRAVTSGTSITLPTNSKFSNGDLVFDGWTLDSLNGPVHQAGSSYTPTKNVTFYAKWKSNTVPVVTRSMPKFIQVSQAQIDQWPNQSPKGIFTEKFMSDGGFTDVVYYHSNVKERQPDGTYKIIEEIENAKIAQHINEMVETNSKINIWIPTREMNSNNLNSSFWSTGGTKKELGELWGMLTEEAQSCIKGVYLDAESVYGLTEKVALTTTNAYEKMLEFEKLNPENNTVIFDEIVPTPIPDSELNTNETVNENLIEHESEISDTLDENNNEEESPIITVEEDSLLITEELNYDDVISDNENTLSNDVVLELQEITENIDTSESEIVESTENIDTSEIDIIEPTEIEQEQDETQEELEMIEVNEGSSVNKIRSEKPKFILSYQEVQDILMYESAYKVLDLDIPEEYYELIELAKVQDVTYYSRISRSTKADSYIAWNGDDKGNGGVINSNFGKALIDSKSFADKYDLDMLWLPYLPSQKSKTEDVDIIRLSKGITEYISLVASKAGYFDYIILQPHALGDQHDNWNKFTVEQAHSFAKKNKVDIYIRKNLIDLPTLIDGYDVESGAEVKIGFMYEYGSDFKTASYKQESKYNALYQHVDNPYVKYTGLDNSKYIPISFYWDGSWSNDPITRISFTDLVEQIK